MVTEIWSGIDRRERMAVSGAGLIVVSWLLGLVLSGGYFGAIGAGGLGLLGALALLAVVYVHHAPNTAVTLPAPYTTIMVVVSAVVGIVALLELLQTVQFLGVVASYAFSYFVALVLYIAGAALMVWGSYQEWQVSKSGAA